MRVIFLGSGEFGLPTIERIHADFDLVAVVTQPDRPAGRRRQVTGTAIGQWADRAGRHLVKTGNANDTAIIEHLSAFKPQAAVVVAFGQKLSNALIDVLGALVINVHASLLPKFRGAAPINWAMISGGKCTGLSIISLAQRIDGGQIYAQTSTAIDARETAGELHDRLAVMGPDLVRQVLSDSQAGALTGCAQDESQVSLAPKLSKADGWVRFDCGADEVRGRIHGLTPWPGVMVNWQESSGQALQMIRILRVEALPGNVPVVAPGTVLEGNCVAVSDGVVRLVEVQRPGGRPMAIEEFVRGRPLMPGDHLLTVKD